MKHNKTTKCPRMALQKCSPTIVRTKQNKTKQQQSCVQGLTRAHDHIRWSHCPHFKDSEVVIGTFYFAADQSSRISCILLWYPSWFFHSRGLLKLTLTEFNSKPNQEWVRINENQTILMVEMPIILILWKINNNGTMVLYKIILCSNISWLWG